MDEQHSLAFVIVSLIKSGFDVVEHHDFRSVAACSLEVVPWSALVGENDRPASQHLSGVSDSLSMIPAAHRNHARLSADLQMRKNFVEGSANFKSAGGLENFQFQVDVSAEHVAQRATADQWRPLDVIADSLLRLLHIFERDHWETIVNGLQF